MTLDDLQHPDCRACEERKRLSVGQLAEIADLKRKLGGLPVLERAVKGAIEDLEEEARFHWLRGDKLGEEGRGRAALKGEHRIAERLRERADELQRLLSGGEK